MFGLEYGFFGKKVTKVTVLDGVTLQLVVTFLETTMLRMGCFA